MFDKTRVVKREFDNGKLLGYFIQKRHPLFFWVWEDCHHHPVSIDEAKESEYMFKSYITNVIKSYAGGFRVVEQLYNNGEFRGFFVQKRSFCLWENCHVIRYESADHAKEAVDYWHQRHIELLNQLCILMKKYERK